MRPAVWLLLAGILASSAGCVTRRYLVTSNPQGAIVYADGQYIGPTPCSVPFTYYGKYRFRVVKDGYDPVDIEPELVAPWWQYPGIDFVAENVYPFALRDQQVIPVTLRPSSTAPIDEGKIRADADRLRMRGAAIVTPPGTEAPPRPTPRPQPAPVPVVPAPVGPAPIVPAPENAAPPGTVPVPITGPIAPSAGPR